MDTAGRFGSCGRRTRLLTNDPRRRKLSSRWLNHGQDTTSRFPATTVTGQKPFEYCIFMVEVTGFEPVAPTLRT
jgi:hypothetical protein